MIRRVELSARARKQLQRVPRHIVENLAAWVDVVETEGLSEARKVPGDHDEPLLGARAGARAIRLSRAYHALYVQRGRGGDTVMVVTEVMKHAY